MTGIETALAIGSLAASAGGTALSMMGQSQQATATAEAANYRAVVARRNQVIAQQNAQREQEVGEIQVSNQGMKTRNAVGAAKAAQASSGLDVNVGSPVDVRNSTEALGMLDAMTLMNNAQQRSYGYLTQGSNFGSQATLESMTADNARTAGTMNEFSSLVSGASSFSDKWLTYKNRGIF